MYLARYTSEVVHVHVDVKVLCLYYTAPCNGWWTPHIKEAHYYFAVLDFYWYVLCMAKCIQNEMKI